MASDDDDRIDAIKYPTAASIQINARTENSELRFEKARELARRVVLLEAKARVHDAELRYFGDACDDEESVNCPGCREYEAAWKELNALEAKESEGR